MTVRVRFAPSPTGALHIGGARTALFNWLFARHHQGTFLLRIEDTDRERSTKEFETTILDGMAWLGMDWDGDPVYQSGRSDLYTRHVEKLLAEDKAYRCYCSPEQIDAMRAKAQAEGRKPKYDGTCRERADRPDEPFVVRFKAPLEGTTSFHDMCRGTIETDNRELDDLIIARSDGTPTYNFVVVIDDVDMKITHVVRGDDHINNTPKQVMLYNALGYPLPEFAHLPMIHGPDKKKLSKRHGAASVTEYRDMGYLPEALANYLARLGWAHGDQEIFTREELVEKFDLDVCGSSPSVFDPDKLLWVNSQHILRHSNEELVDLVEPFLNKLGLRVTDRAYAAHAMDLVRERGRTLAELAEKAAFLFRPDIVPEEKAAAQWLSADGLNTLRLLRDKLAAHDDFYEEGLASFFKRVVEETGVKMKKVAQPLRVALTGTTASPGLYEIMALMGKDRVMKRVNDALEQAER